MKNCAFILLFAALAVFADGGEQPVSSWALPRLWPTHSQLRQELVGALRRGDVKAMESVCRAGIKTLPGDPTWHYNLACALAHQGNPEVALDELETAISFGFRNADAIAQDKDFAQLKDLPRFAELVEKARALTGQPVPGRPKAVAKTVPMGATSTLSETNLVFSFETGLFVALVDLKPPKTPLTALATNFLKSTPKSPLAVQVAGWLADGSAAGNTGDIYLNRDRNHSAISLGDFPHLTGLAFTKDSQVENADICHANTLFPGAVFANCSRAYTKGPYWRSLGRHTFTEAGLVQRMDQAYYNNQVWFFPACNDFGKPDIGDVFPANAPFQFLSVGASWSDKPFLQAALAASASFPKVTKEAILRRHLMGPTIQWLLRRAQKGISNEEDYLTSPKAHPTAFKSDDLDRIRLVQKAHILQPEQVPPAVCLDMINSKLFPIKFPQPGRDYPDLLPEVLFAAKSAVSIILRGTAGEQTYLFRARPFPEADPTAVFTWRVVHGDPKRVKIEPPLGESLDRPESGYAQITIDRRGLTNRLDVACFAKSKDTEFGAPSIISFKPVALETRTYRADGKIEAIDYTNPGMVYCDPHLALPRDWTDTYTYAEDGRCTGFRRTRRGQLIGEFTRADERIVARDAGGKPQQLVKVKYIPRQTGIEMQPLELTFTDDGEPYEALR